MFPAWLRAGSKAVKTGPRMPARALGNERIAQIAGSLRGIGSHELKRATGQRKYWLTGSAGLNALPTMSNNSNSTVSWQFRLADDSSNSAGPRGVRFICARRASRGPWLTHDQLPACVREYFCLEIRGGVPFVEGFESIAELRKDATDIRVQKSPANELKAIVAIDTPRVSMGTVPALEGFTSGDGAKWGVSDFYEDKEAALLAALASGKDFTTGWYGVKKENESGCVTRVGRMITCEASVSNDLDTEGKGEVEIHVGRKGPKSLLAAIKEGLEKASEQAVDN